MPSCSGAVADSGVASWPMSPSITFATASDSSGSTSVSVTSAIPSGGRFAVPLKMQSAMRSARSILWLCSPRTQEIASTTLDLPHPFGPTMQVMPLPLNVIGVLSKKDLKPSNSTLRSFNTQALARDRFPCPRCAEEIKSSLQPHRQKKLRWKVTGKVFRDKNAGGSIVDGPAAWRYDGGYGNLR